MIVFRDGPAGRRARLASGPDVWQVVRAVRSSRESEPELSAEEILALVSRTAGVPEPLIRAAVAYWADFPDEIDAFIARADEVELRERRRWEREHGLLAG